MIAEKNTVDTPTAAKPTPSELKIRVLAIKDRLPANVRALLFKRFPERNTAQGAKKIDNVLTGASSDEELTEYMESLAAPQA